MNRLNAAMSQLNKSLDTLLTSVTKLHTSICITSVPTKTVNVLSWDCGLKSTSWTYMSVHSNGLTDIHGYGTIDFLNGQNFWSVKKIHWPKLICKGLKDSAPAVVSLAPDTVIVIEAQPLSKKFIGSVAIANIATQFCISQMYALTHEIVFIDPKLKNTIGPIFMKKLGTVLKITDPEAIRKKHTRMNFELFMILRYSKKFGRGSQKIIKLRDVSDSFMQGIHYARDRINGNTVVDNTDKLLAKKKKKKAKKSIIERY